MPTYISLVKWTDQGIRNVKESPARLDAATQATEAVGGKTIAFYLTMGRYDVVIISEYPNDEAAATVLLGIASRGNVRTETLRAFTEDQYRDVIAKIR